MKIIKNEKLIKRNGQFGQYISLAALLVLGLGMYISFAKPEWFTWSVVCLLIGFIMTQVGMYMGNRWGRSPRPDEKLDAGLKGLPGENTLYHFSTPVSHLVAGPSGLWVLLPYHQRGKIEWNGKRWRMSGGGFMQNYMRIFGQEGLGRPDLDAANEVEELTKFLAKGLNGAEMPPIKPVLVFTNDEVEIEANDAPVAAMKLKQLKDFLRQSGKTKALEGERLGQVLDLLGRG